ncbi:hypothetical protein KIN20_037385 [Parelaphostrongylus tenuis]|uniref:Uncharacterized protein n=1 Tax=Parelaphostrongylus tenuis TaxID=148309 RepID=A0AAD5RDV8_PARTN|nr:hypothetical protein KIN20_037385 [Parelaphostrongylus tenuis]
MYNLFFGNGNSEEDGRDATSPQDIMVTDDSDAVDEIENSMRPMAQPGEEDGAEQSICSPPKPLQGRE